MAEIAIITVLSIIAAGIALSILWRVFVFVLKLVFVFVLIALVVKAVFETIWGAILIVFGLILGAFGLTMKAVQKVRRTYISAQRRRRFFA